MTVPNAMILVDQTAVPLALPTIMKQFGVGTDVAEWVLNASLLALSGLLILGGSSATCSAGGASSCSGRSYSRPGQP